jgi:dolichol-phosphate mannosyltransferase
MPLSEAFVSVVLPVYNEARVLPELVERLSAALSSCGCRYEVIFVNDGSRDDSSAVLDDLAARDPFVRVLHFSRNFGHQAAVQAGLLQADGDVVAVMDADLQDDPDALPRLLEQWAAGYDVVYVIRTARKENPLKRFLFAAFYRVLNLVSEIPMPMDAGNFGLVDRRVAQEIARLPDRDRYYSGLRRWVGFSQVGVVVERGARYDGQPRVSLRGLWQLAKTALFSFSALPLTIFYTIAGLSFLLFAGLAGFTLYHKLFTGLAVSGWTSILMTVCFFGSLNALGIAILGEYVWRIYNQVRARPLFMVQRRVNCPARQDADWTEEEAPIARRA